MDRVGQEIKILASVWGAALAAVLCPDGKERSAYFLGYRSGNIAYLERLIVPPENAYVSHSPGYMRIKKEWLGEYVFGEAVRGNFDVVADVHSHPFGHGGVSFSSMDDASDHKVLSHIQVNLPLAKEEIGEKVEMTGIALVVDRASVDARGYDHVLKRFQPVERIVVLGNKNLEIIYPTSAKGAEPAPSDIQSQYSRQIEIFGLPGQMKMANVRVAICGAGGLGSILAEAVLRLGVRDVTVIDDDNLDASNLHRWQGGSPGDVGKPKVGLIKAMHERNFPDATITAICKSVYDEESAVAISGADVVLGSVDNGPARAFLSRLCAQYMIPYLDGAAQIVKRSGSDATPVYRIGFMVPGVTSCFDCTQVPIYKSEEVHTAFLNQLVQKVMRAKGYLSEAPKASGATVYGLNLACVGAMVLEFQNYLVGDRRPAHRFSSAEFLSGNAITVDGAEAIPSRIEFGHGLAQPDDDCPYCQGRRAGRMGTLRLMRPSTAEREAKLPNAQDFLSKGNAINGKET